MVYLTVICLCLSCAVVIMFYRCCSQRNNRKAFRKLIDHVNIGYCKFRVSDGGIIEVNKGFKLIFGLDGSEGDIAGHVLNELMICADSEQSLYETLKRMKETKNYEYRFKTLAGKDKYALFNSCLQKDPVSKEEIIEAIIEDVTEQRKAYDKMKESRERYSRLFRDSGDIVIICRLNGFIIDEVNPVAEKITGFTLDELMGEPLEKFLHPSYRNRLKEGKEDLLFKGDSRVEAVLVARDGTYREVIMTLSLAEINDDTIVMAVVKDVSGLIRDREEQKKRNREMEDFWKSAVEREERINNLRQELEALKLSAGREQRKNEDN